MLFNHCNKVMLGETAKSRDAEARVAGQKIFRLHIQVSEVAAPAAGNTDFLRQFLSVVKNQHRTPALAGFYSAHQACRPGPDDNDVKIVQRISLLMAFLGGPLYRKSPF